MVKTACDVRLIYQTTQCRVESQMRCDVNLPRRNNPIQMLDFEENIN